MRIRVSLLLLLAATASGGAFAANFTVNAETDTGDANIGDTLCDDGAGTCTLRAAIEEANATPALDNVAFNIPGFTNFITLLSPLPVISEDLNITGEIPDYTRHHVRANAAPFTGTFRVFEIDPGVTVNFAGFTISNGRDIGAAGVNGEDGAGAGILNNGDLTLDYMGIQSNQAGGGAGSTGDGGHARGGGIYNAGFLLMRDSYMAGNRADGGAAPIGIGGDGLGGAIYNTETANATIVRTTIGACVAQGASSSSTGGSGYGGGIYIENLGAATGAVMLSHSTIGQNTASGRNGLTSGQDGVSHGGGIYIAGSGSGIQLRSEFSTIALNNAFGFNDDGGGIYYGGAASAAPRIRSTLLGNNVCANGAPDVFGFINSSGHNLVESTTGLTLRTTGTGADSVANSANGNLLGLDPNLGGLVDNGGPAATYALLDPSPAYNAGSANNLNGTPPAVDQRGQPRPSFGFNDIGAYESTTVVPVETSAAGLD